MYINNDILYASEINLSRHTLKLKLPKYHLKKGSIPQYRKPQCLPSSPCNSLGSSHCGKIYIYQYIVYFKS